MNYGVKRVNFMECEFYLNLGKKKLLKNKKTKRVLEDEAKRSYKAFYEVLRNLGLDL